LLIMVIGLLRDELPYPVVINFINF
jgi:hypothetical protein